MWTIKLKLADTENSVVVTMGKQVQVVKGKRGPIM